MKQKLIVRKRNFPIFEIKQVAKMLIWWLVLFLRQLRSLNEKSKKDGKIKTKLSIVKNVTVEVK